MIARIGADEIYRSFCMNRLFCAYYNIPFLNHMQLNHLWLNKLDQLKLKPHSLSNFMMSTNNKPYTVGSFSIS